MKLDAAAVDTVKSEEVQVIGLKIAGEEYAVRINRVQEVVPPPQITRVPRSPDFVMGVINLRGSVIPVIDMARRFEIGTTELGSQSRIVAVEIDGETVGLIAESVRKVSNLLESDLKSPPPNASKISEEYLQWVAHQDDGFLVFMDLEKALSKQDSREIKVG